MQHGRPFLEHRRFPASFWVVLLGRALRLGRPLPEPLGLHFWEVMESGTMGKVKTGSFTGVVWAVKGVL
jgi:hypothetical protein